MTLPPSKSDSPKTKQSLEQNPQESSEHTPQRRNQNAHAFADPRVVVSSASSYTPASLLPPLFKLNPRPSRIWPCITLGSICVLYVYTVPTQHTWLFTYTDSSLHTNKREGTVPWHWGEVGNLHCSGTPEERALCSSVRSRRGETDWVNLKVLFLTWYILQLTVLILFSYEDLAKASIWVFQTHWLNCNIFIL